MAFAQTLHNTHHRPRMVPSQVEVDNPLTPVRNSRHNTFGTVPKQPLNRLLQGSEQMARLLPGCRERNGQSEQAAEPPAQGT